MGEEKERGERRTFAGLLLRLGAADLLHLRLVRVGDEDLLAVELVALHLALALFFEEQLL